MITEEQYIQACDSKKAAEALMHDYHLQEIAAFKARIASGVPFTDEELIYSAETLCPCGHGLAYPKKCAPGHYWDCSAILKGVQDDAVQHTARLPFAFYDVKAEGERMCGGTTRGIYRPKPKDFK